jgi:uncharacterized membrane protein YhaH (DUF805 family)
MFVLFTFIILAVLFILTMIVHIFGIVMLLFELGIIVPVIAVTARRLHDTGRSGWWMLIAFVPFVGGIILLVFEVMESQPGSNQYGPNPLESAA